MKTDRPDDQTYQPISCDTYSELEVAILHRQRLHLTWSDGNVCYTQTVLPLDLQTQAGEEFLHIELTTHERTRVRLDRIQRLTPA